MVDTMVNFSNGHSFYFDHVFLRPEEQIGLHSQSTWELSYIITGAGECRFGDSVSKFSDSEVVLVPPEMPHCWTFDKNIVDAEGKIENITLVFNADLLTLISSSFHEIEELMHRFETVNGALRFVKSEAKPFIQILDKMTSQTEAERLMSCLSLVVLLAENMDKARTYGNIDRTTEVEKRLKSIETYVNCNFKREINLDSVAHHVGMNRSAFCTFFKKAKGVTFINYLNAYRIDVACYLLSRNTGSIAEVCYQSGFRDIPYFNRVFKRLKGVSPGKYKEKISEA
jgi:YesN/AraC family two-component response regulator